MKILLLTHAFHPHIGGLETVARLLAEQFAARGHKVRVVTPTPAATPDDDSQFPYEIIRRPGLVALLRHACWCDIFFQNNISLRTLWPLLLVRRPWVVTLHTWLQRVSGQLAWRDRLKLWILRFGTVVSVSRAVAARLPMRSILLNNPFESKVFQLDGQGGDGGDFFRRERRLISAGRLVSDKGIDVLLDAVAELRRSDGAVIGPAPLLTIVGDGPDREALERQAAELGIAEDVNFAGAMSATDLSNLMRQHRVMVIPSRNPEPFGLVALEGAACGCVPVASDCGGLPDAVGWCGVVVPPGDALTLSATLRRILRDETYSAELRAAAPAHLAKHDPAQVADEYLSVFQRLLDGETDLVEVG